MNSNQYKRWKSKQINDKRKNRACKTESQREAWDALLKKQGYFSIEEFWTIITNQ